MLMTSGLTTVLGSNFGMRSGSVSDGVIMFYGMGESSLPSVSFVEPVLLELDFFVILNFVLSPNSQNDGGRSTLNSASQGCRSISSKVGRS